MANMNLIIATIALGLALAGACLAGWQLFESMKGRVASVTRRALILILLIGGLVIFMQNIKWAIYREMRVGQFRDYPLRKGVLE